MKNKFNFSFIFFIYFLTLQAQVNNLQLPTSINETGADPDASAILDVQSQNQGVLIPRMDFTQINNIPNPEDGLMIYDIEFSCLRIYDNGVWNCLQTVANSAGTGKGNGALTGWNVPYQGEADPVEFDVNSNDQIVVLGDFDDGFEDYLATFDQSGNLIWDLRTQDSQSSEMVVDNNNFIFIAGFTLSGQGITKFDPNGNLIWTHPLGFTGAISVDITQMEADDSGNIILGGYFIGDIAVGANTFINQGGRDCFIAKYDPNGTLLWIQTLGGTGLNESLTGLCIDSQSNIYTLGSFQNDLSTGNLSISSSRPVSYFYSKLLPNGSVSRLSAFESDSNLLLGECVINELDEISFPMVVSKDFYYSGGSQTINQAGNQFLIVATFNPASNFKIRGVTSLTTTVSNLKIMTSLNNDFYVSATMSGYSGLFGNVNYDLCPGKTYMIKYPYLISNSNKPFEYIVPLPMVYDDVEFIENKSVYLFGTLRGQARLGNTVLTESHTEHNIFFAKYIE